MGKHWALLWWSVGVILFLLFAHRAWFIPETDYVAYYQAGARAWQRSNLYFVEQTPFKYLPIVSLLFIPLGALPFQVSKFCFYLICFGMGVWIYRQVGKRYGNGICLFTLVAMLRFHNHDFLNAQVNHFLLFLFILYLGFRNKFENLAPFIFALFASFKVVPLLILGPLLCMRRFKEASKICIWFVILSLLPVLFFKDGFSLYAHWFELLRATTEFPASSDAMFQSIQSMLSYGIGQLLPALMNHFSLFSQFVCMGLLLVTCGYGFKMKDLRDEQVYIVGCLILSVILSPLAWKHNYLLILPAYVLLLERKRFVSVGISFFLMAILPTAIGVFSKEWVDRSYMTVWGALILWQACLRSSSRVPLGVG